MLAFFEVSIRVALGCYEPEEKNPAGSDYKSVIFFSLVFQSVSTVWTSIFVHPVRMQQLCAA